MQDNSRKYIKAMLGLFCAMFLILCVYLVYIVGVYGNRWFTSPYNTRLQAQKNSVQAGRIADRNGQLLAYTDGEGQRRYASEKARRRAVCHVVGDSYGQTLGAESMFAKYLLGFDQDMADLFAETFGSATRTGSSVMLTIDGELCDYAYDLMDDYWGAVVLMNYKTGEVLCSVSQPTFDPNYMQEYIDGERELAASAMVNRVTMGKYTPGSTFKTVTLIAALRYIPGVTERTFDCDGALVFDRETGKYLPDVAVDDAEFVQADQETDYDREQEGVQDTGAEPATVEKYSIVRDSNSNYHGEISLFEAYAHSCNTTFARLAMEVGADKMTQTAKELGIGDEFLFEDMLLYSSSYEKPDTDPESCLERSGAIQGYHDPHADVYAHRRRGQRRGDDAAPAPIQSGHAKRLCPLHPWQQGIQNHPFRGGSGDCAASYAGHRGIRHRDPGGCGWLHRGGQDRVRGDLLG